MVDQPDAEAGDDCSFPTGHGEALGEPKGRQLQGDCRDEHLQDDEHDQADAESAEADDRRQEADNHADAGEERAANDSLGPEAAMDGNTGDDGGEGVGEEESHDDDASDEIHDLLSK